MHNIPTFMYKNVNDFLSELDPAKSKWDGWHFRGQPDSTFELVPSVWREDKNILFARFSQELTNHNELRTHVEQMQTNSTHKFDVDRVLKYKIHVRFENYLLSNFYSSANRAGLKIPDSQLQLCKTYASEYWKNGKENSWGGLGVNFFNAYKDGQGSRFAGAIAFEPSLPQHYGLPTRILDWTSNPRKASFFAVYEYLKNIDANNSDTIAVYGIKQNKANDGKNFIQIVNEHSRYANKFLHAQDGSFTQIHGDFIYWEEGIWPSIDYLYKKYGNNSFELNKFILPSKYATEVLERLDRCGISISEMMPDYKHISEDVLTKMKNI